MQKDDPELQEALNSLRFMGTEAQVNESADGHFNMPAETRDQAGGLHDTPELEADDTDIDMEMDCV